ncbi:MAG: excinuclease ABC subunit UvrC [Eubacteriales bacterium]
MFDINEELKKLPNKPGVYIMKNKKDQIIYIGKAINLKNRVRQYFQSSRNMMFKIKKMVSNIDHFEYIVTDSELEALILECNLIKLHRPKYNTMLKDDKHYPYIKVTVNEIFPRVLFTRNMKKDKAKYFGPYTSGKDVKETIDLIQKIWKIRTCNRNLPKDTGKERPCLNYHMMQCLAPCQGHINESDYKKMIDEILDFLGGQFNHVTKMLEEKMVEASEQLEFEKAAELRDQLNSVKHIAQKQKMINSTMEDQDIIAFARAHNEALVQVFFVRNGKLVGREHFRLNGVEELERTEVMTNFVKQFYSGTPYIPKELILQEEIEDKKIINEWLSEKRGHKVYIKVPVKGEKSKLVELAAKNAILTLEQFGEKIKREEKRTIGAVKDIIKYLRLGQEVNRIEAYDISNTGGFQSVGSMVVYENGKPKRSDYRKFKIKWVKGPDDYASMEEVLTRRFTHAIRERKELEEKGLGKEYGKFTFLPDLILMDGGKGQVNIALKVLNSLAIDIPVCGMVKDDHHRTRGLYYNGEEISIDKNTEAFKLLTRIQDEVHRFAIEYHRKLRSKTQVQSILDDIKGIGPVRRKALIRKFNSVENIRKATIEELEKVEGLNYKAAKAVYEFFH